VLKYLAGSDFAQPLILMVADHLVIVLYGAVAGVDCIMKTDDAIFQCNDHRHQLEGGAGLRAFAYCVVVGLMVQSVRSYLEVCDGLDVAGLHLHHHSATVMGFVFRELLVQSVLCRILQVKIDGGDNIVSGAGVYRLEVIDIDPCSSCQALLHLQPVLPGEVVIE